jgi:hypothetical protein
VAGIYLLAISRFADSASTRTDLEQGSNFSVVFDDVGVVHGKFRISSLKYVFVVDSVAQLSGENPDFRYLLGTVEEKDQVRFSGLNDNEQGQLGPNVLLTTADIGSICSRSLGKPSMRTTR